MKSCKNCYYYDNCPDNGERCEYYAPLYGEDKIALQEYEDDLKERVKEYQNLVDEQQG